VNLERLAVERVNLLAADEHLRVAWRRLLRLGLRLLLDGHQ
jgi:hypothetical protein